MLKTLFKKKGGPAPEKVSPEAEGVVRQGSALPPAKQVSSSSLSAGNGLAATSGGVPTPSMPAITPLQLSAAPASLERSETMSARLNPDVTGRREHSEANVDHVETGLELLRLGLTVEQERALSIDAREALVAARVARARRGAAERYMDGGPDVGTSSGTPAHQDITLHSLDLSLRGDQEDRFHALRELQAQQLKAPLPFKLDLGHELLQLKLSDGQANQLTPRGRDALVAARVARARGSNHQTHMKLSLVNNASVAAQHPAVKPLQLDGVVPQLQHSETMSARLNPDMTSRVAGNDPDPLHADSDVQGGATCQVASVDAGLELLRLDLSEEQQKNLSLGAREALVAARIAYARRGDSTKQEDGEERDSQDVRQRLVNSLDLSLRGDQRERVCARGEMQIQTCAAPKPFKLDLGRELLHLQLSGGQANQLTPRGRDALVAARVARARGRKDEARLQPKMLDEPLSPLASSQDAIKPLRLSRVGPTLQRTETMSARLNPDLSARSSRVSRMSKMATDTNDTETVMWRELGVALASAQLSFADEVKLSARGRDALNEARAEVAAGGLMDAAAATAGYRWLEFAQELDSIGMTEAAEKELSTFARDALAAARGARAHVAMGLREGEEASLSKASRPWVEFGMELDAVGLFEGEEKTLSIQGRDALVAARVLRARSNTAAAGEFEQPIVKCTDRWVDFGLQLDDASLTEHDEQALSSFAQDSLCVVRALRARGALTLQESPEAKLSKAKREWMDFGLQLDALGLDEDDELSLSSFARDAIIAARALRARGGLDLEENGESGLSTANRQWIEFGFELLAAGLNEDEEQSLSSFARSALQAARACSMRGFLVGQEGVEKLTSRQNRRWADFGAHLHGCALGEDEERELSTFSRDAMALARVLRGRLNLAEVAESVASKPHREWLEFGFDLHCVGLSEDEERKLSVQGRDARIAARALLARERNESAPSRSNRVQGPFPDLAGGAKAEGFEAAPSKFARTPFGTHMQALVSEGSETHPGSLNRPWVKLGLELSSVGLSEADEKKLSCQGRDALILARALWARENSEATPSKSDRCGKLAVGFSSYGGSKENEASPSEASRPWVAFGLHLDSIGLTESEELQLSSSGRDALVAARCLRLREGAEAKVSESSRSFATMPKSLTTGCKEGLEAALSSPAHRWLEMGFELDLVGLSEADEEGLSSQTRDAMVAARAMRRQESTEASLSVPKRDLGAATKFVSANYSECREAVLGKADRSWLAFGWELDSIGLSEADERQLSREGRDALVAARALRLREQKEAVPSKYIGERRASPTLGSIDETEHRETSTSETCRPWIDFGIQLDNVGLSEHNESALSSKGRDALIAARVLLAREATEAKPSTSDRHDAKLAPGSTDVQECAESKPSKLHHPWIDFGLELDSVGLSESDEKALSSQGRDALIAARGVREREATEAKLSTSERRGAMLAPGSTDVEECAESKPSKPRRPWVDFGLELDSVGLSESDEKALSSQGRDALIAARALRMREAAEAKLSTSDRRSAMLAPGSTDVEECAESKPSKPRRPWVDFGLELDSVGLSESDEKALSSQGRDALIAARALRMREAAEAKPSRTTGPRAMPLSLNINKTEGSETAPNVPHHPWIDFGRELDFVGLHEEEERALSGQGRDAIVAARILRAREKPEAVPSHATRRGTPPDLGSICREGAERRPPGRGMVDFGIELDSIGLSEAEENELSAQGRDALMAARILRTREATENAPNKPGHHMPSMPANSKNQAEGAESTLSVPDRPWMAFGCELDDLGLTEAEEKSLSFSGRDALLAARALRSREAQEAKPSKMRNGPRSVQKLPDGGKSEGVKFIPGIPHRAQGSEQGQVSDEEHFEKTPSLPKRSWIDFGRELDSVGMTEAEEKKLSRQGREALLAARLLRAREGPELRPSHANRRNDATPGRTRNSECDEKFPSAPIRPWVDFGCELDDLGLSEEGEMELSCQARDALLAARTLRAREAPEAPTSKSSTPSSAPAGILVDMPGDDVGLANKLRGPWLDFGAELESIVLSEAEERALVGPARDAFDVARGLRSRDADEAHLTAPLRMPALKPLATMPLAAPQASTPFTDFWSINSPRTPRQAAALLKTGMTSAASPSVRANKSAHQDAPGNACSIEEKIVHEASLTLNGAANIGHDLDIAPTQVVRPNGDVPDGDAACAPREQSIFDHVASLGGWFRGWGSHPATPSSQIESPASTAKAPQQPSATNLPFKARIKTEVAMAVEDTDEPSTSPIDGESTDASNPASSRHGDPAATVDTIASSQSNMSRSAHPNWTINSSLAVGSATMLRRPVNDSMHATVDVLNKASLGTEKGLTRPADRNFGVETKVHELDTDMSTSGLGIGLVGRHQVPDAPHIYATTAPNAEQPNTPQGNGVTREDISLAMRQHIEHVPHSYASAASLGGAQEVRPGVHDANFDDSERQALIRHVGWALRADPDVGHLFPLDVEGGQLFTVAANGILFSKFVAHVDPSGLDCRALNLERGGPLNTEQKLQNHTLCLNAAISLGCGVQKLTAQQMLAACDNQQAALQLLWNLTRTELLNPIDTTKIPDLFSLLLPGEDSVAFSKFRPEQVLLRWINHHIRCFIESNPGHTSCAKTFRISNLHTDLADGVALSVLLHQVLPREIHGWEISCDALCTSLSVDQRANQICLAAQNAGIDLFEVVASDITTPRPRLLLGFVAAIFHAFPGLQEATAPSSTPKRTIRGSPSQAREERALRMWMASLGLGLEYISSLYEDCRDGVAFLKILDFLQPGSIVWSEVVLQPRSIYERVQNCNRSVSTAQKRGLHVEGIAGKDLADGLSTYILSMASQLMRSHACQFLNDLGMGETDVLAWANCQVRRCDTSVTSLRSFSDPAIRDGVFLLQLLRSVADDCVRPELILSGENELEREQNAKYTISCAHKMGCLVFATWEDIVEARARSILCLLAAAMAEDLRRHDAGL